MLQIAKFLNRKCNIFAPKCGWLAVRTAPDAENRTNISESFL